MLLPQRFFFYSYMMISFQMSKIPFNPRRIYPRDCQERGSLLCINCISITFLKSLGIAEWFFLKMKVLQFPCSFLLITKEKSHSGNFLGPPRIRCYSGLKIIYLLSNSTKLSAEHHSLFILFSLGLLTLPSIINIIDLHLFTTWQ